MEECIQKPFQNLKKTITDFTYNKINVNDLKKVSSSYGIYPQKNDLFMIRVRLTGGEIKTKQLNSIYEIIKNYEVPYIRLTTRQDIQLHDVNLLNINQILDALVDSGFVFRGGGGDTFRNITVSYDSGISKDSLFDVFPFAEKMTEVIYRLDKAYNLPRKIKIAFSSDESDKSFAKWSDLGFIAKKDQNGNLGFEVYIGGGMGRNSSPALNVFDFLKAEECIKSAIAMINLFSEHGDRENRGKARIRFIKEKLGETEFIKLYKSYFDREVSQFSLSDFSKRSYFETQEKNNLRNDDYGAELEDWLKVFSQESLNKNYSIVRIPVNSGNLNSSNLKALTEVFCKFNIKWARINRVHEFVILIYNSLLENFYTELNKCNNGCFTKTEFKNRIISCIGNTVCPMGLINSQKFSEEISKVLDNVCYKEKRYLYTKLINSITISGCGNSCSNADVFSIRGKGTRKKINDVMTELCVLNISRELLLNSDEDLVFEVSIDDLYEKFSKVLTEKIDFKVNF